ncbi:MAG: zinc carboxypeptidase [Bacteroidales bacterium]|nr:zinc carboxypeptidase [Bacteroidales bacterium]
MKRTLLLSVILLGSLMMNAQPGLSYYLPSGIAYNPSIPPPSSFIGHDVGEWHVTHDKLVGYMKLLDGISERAVWEDYGKSWEGRPLGQLIITSEKNMERLEEIRLEHLKLSDPAVSKGVRIDDMPLVIKLGYGVHGNESSAQNASLLTAYYLVAGQGPAIDEILANTVILIDPSLNPDGLQRHSTWVNMYRGMTLTTDPSGREFSEAWPGGRTNHYWFDLNRDYIMLQQPETVGRVEAFFRWMPNINNDHHEMGANSTFFFQPGVQSRNNPMVPPENQELTAMIGKYHAKHLDSIGSLYYTEESFDDYYVGKGSSYPDIHGSVGILYEQAGVKGHLREVPAGLLSFPFAIRNQFTVSLSTIEAGIVMRTKLLNMQRDFYLSAISEAEASTVKGFVFRTGDDRSAAGKFIENLLRHKIEIYRSGRNITKNGVIFSSTDSYFVPLKQKEYRFVRSLFEPVSRFADTVFYDISTWVMPMAFNLSYSTLNGSEVTGMTGEKVTEPPLPHGNVTGDEKPYAWLFEWSDSYAPRALYMIQSAGLTARVSARPFTVSTGGKEKKFGYGTIMVHSPENHRTDEEMTAIMKGVADECGITIYGVSTGLTPAGIDLGSNDFIPLARPSVMLLVDEGIPSDDAGEIWHLLDVRYGMQVTLMPASRLVSANLSRYNVIIVAGNPSMPQAVVDRVREWNRTGGTIIACKGGNRWLAGNGFAEIDYIENASVPASAERRYADRQADRALHMIPGSIFLTRIDVTHPLCYGYTGEYLPVFKSDATAVKLTGNTYNSPVRYTSAPLLSGYCSKENLTRISNSVFACVQPGPGRVISIYDETSFRAVWFGTAKILANAVFFGQTLRQESRYGQ